MFGNIKLIQQKRKDKFSFNNVKLVKKNRLLDLFIIKTHLILALNAKLTL